MTDVEPRGREASETPSATETDAERRARKTFGPAAERYAASAIHAHGEDLDWMVELAGEVNGRAVLDVASGAGHTALRFAQAGARVTATDLTPEMIATASRLAGERGLEVDGWVAPADRQPFADVSFDVLTCRAAAHHFDALEPFLHEARRLLKPNGLLLIVDNIAPADGELDAAMNEIERLRDPSHVRAYRVGEWTGTLADAGFDLCYLRRWRREKEFGPWMERAGADAPTVQAVEAAVRGLSPRARDYLTPREEGGRLISLGHEVVLLASVRRV